ncbi:MAG: YaiO family outer membrane beta-barrel protein [Bacteroidetes bacterium]|nr:MAG: YaiO family outer membrane beta-barrel protein [Bacteroidota bacterium]
MKEPNRYFVSVPPKIALGCILMFLLIVHSALFAQPPVEEDPDGWFFRARELAFEGKNVEARDICRQILEKYPNYHDVKILKARTYSWEGEFVRSNDLLREVLQAEPSNKEALFALIDLQIWYGDYVEAIKFLDIALASDPNNTHLLYRKALSLKETGDELAAVVLLNQILDLDPTHSEAKDLLDTIESTRLLNHVGIGYRGSYFFESEVDADPWHLWYAEIGRRTRGMGPVILRANYAMRYDVNSLQIEADAYPTVRPGTYLYLNAGFSPDRRLFPITRFGFEIFQTLPATWEISGGFRILNFDERESLIITKDLLIITGSLSKYYKQYYFSFRPYFTFSSVADDPTSNSYFFTARRFFSSTDHHLSLIVGRGFSADYDKLAGGQVYDLSGTVVEAMLMYQQKLSTRFLIKAGVGYKIYETTDDVDVLYGNPTVFEGGLIYRF